MVLCYGSPSKVIQKKRKKGRQAGREKKKEKRKKKVGRRKEWEEGRVDKGKEGRKKFV